LGLGSPEQLALRWHRQLTSVPVINRRCNRLTWTDLYYR
jgi:hypothetical protein